jgi:thiamine biosynthesis lipoprotein
VNTARRARPWLGTLVEIRVEGLDEDVALRAIDAAFAEVAEVHRRMSFHEADSDLARLHRAPVGTPVCVDSRTREVLGCALRIAEESRGCFDPTIATVQVARGALPRPVSPSVPDAQVTWRDIELRDDSVCLRRPLWIDLGGIAKGYAVDRATDILLSAGAEQVCVNAGGDLRIAGARAECVHVRDTHGCVVAIVELANAALATSAAVGDSLAQHIDGVSRNAIHGDRTVSVAAPRCMLADALTKVALAQGEMDAPVFAEFGAQARAHDARRGNTLGAAA